MSLYPFFRPRPFVSEMMRDLARMERQFVPFGAQIDTSEIVNNADKFSVALNVSQFKPEELKINLEGRQLTVEGSQEVKTEHGHSKKSFSRLVLLPEDVDLSALSSSLSEQGTLSIEAPKRQTVQPRSIPICIQDKPAE